MILHKQMPVDLYENDFCCIRKAIKEIGDNAEASFSNENENAED